MVPNHEGLRFNNSLYFKGKLKRSCLRTIIFEVFRLLLKYSYKIIHSSYFVLIFNTFANWRHLQFCLFTLFKNQNAQHWFNNYSSFNNYSRFNEFQRRTQLFTDNSNSSSFSNASVKFLSWGLHVVWTLIWCIPIWLIVIWMQISLPSTISLKFVVI